MNEKVKFKSKTTYLGRNGNGQCIGVDMYRPSENSEGFWFSAINSKDMVARCEILIPVEDIPEIIEALRRIGGDSI